MITMYDKAVEYSQDPQLTTKLFNIMKLEKTFSAPSYNRHSGRTTLDNLNLLADIVHKRIICVLYAKQVEEQPNNSIQIWQHNSSWTKQNKQYIAYLLRTLGMNIIETHNSIKIVK